MIWFITLTVLVYLYIGVRWCFYLMRHEMLVFDDNVGFFFMFVALWPLGMVARKLRDIREAK